MSRNALSAEFIGAAFGQRTGEAIIALLTITPPASYEAPPGSGYTGGVIRASNHNTTRYSIDPLRYGTTSRGQEFTFYPFKPTLPEEGEDAQPTIQIVLDNVLRQITALLSNLTEPAIVTLELVKLSNPDAVEIEFPDFELVTSTNEAGQATLTLSLDSMVSEPYPGYDYTPDAFGGLFASL